VIHEEKVRDLVYLSKELAKPLVYKGFRGMNKWI